MCVEDAWDIGLYTIDWPTHGSVRGVHIVQNAEVSGACPVSVKVLPSTADVGGYIEGTIVGEQGSVIGIGTEKGTAID